MGARLPRRHDVTSTPSLTYVANSELILSRHTNWPSEYKLFPRVTLSSARHISMTTLGLLYAQPPTLCIDVKEFVAYLEFVVVI